MGENNLPTEDWINKRSIHHEGIMPIRVLQYNVIQVFSNLNPGFLELTKKVINDLGLNDGIGYLAEKERVRSPFAVFDKIMVQEVFMSYMWCISFSLSVLYSEVQVKKSKNCYYGNETEIIDLDKARDAYKLWEYAMSLLNDYSEWDKMLPNPELFHPKFVDLIPRIDALFIVAMQYVLAHEFAHIELEHSKNVPQHEDPNQFNAAQEKEADQRAIELVLQGMDGNNNDTIRMGILIGLCSLLFFKSTTKEDAYPDTDNRIDSIMALIDPDEQDAMWGIAVLAYKLWDRYYNVGLVWKGGLESNKALYYYIKKQVE